MRDKLILKLDSNMDSEDWDIVLDEFCSQIYTVINKYEKRYSNKVYGIGLFGKLGRWNGTFDVGKIVRPDGKAVIGGFGSDCREFDIFLGDKGELTVLGYHNDGKIVLKCYLLSESKAERLGLSIGHLNPNKLNSIENKLTRIKLKY